MSDYEMRRTHGTSARGGAVMPTPSSDWEPCAKCGERLDFGTNGMGKIIAQCPVCDWGWRPSREYDLFTRRRAVIVTPPDCEKTPAIERDYAPRSCDVCAGAYKPNNARQRYCSIPCKDAATLQLKAQRQAFLARHRRCECGAVLPLGSMRKYCPECRAQVTKENHRRYWQRKQLSA